MAEWGTARARSDRRAALASRKIGSTVWVDPEWMLAGHKKVGVVAQTGRERAESSEEEGDRFLFRGGRLSPKDNIGLSSSVALKNGAASGLAPPEFSGERYPLPLGRVTGDCGPCSQENAKKLPVAANYASHPAMILARPIRTFGFGVT